ncbi:semaphorin-4B-like [Centropristis striata]|uniref:semaphorin-4B-like n=1 Tax=Centropristis striata TaxID=184440 RepID=UPI0027DF5532|nr:semaphorin-4B-like [Centropristis striata]
MAPPVLLLLLLLSSVSSLPPPRTSFPLNSVDRPLVHFSGPNTTTLLLSPDGSTLYVGARDAVLSLDVSRSDVIRQKKKVEWRPSDREIDDCRNKGKDAAMDCPNFVRVLQLMNSTHLYVCGSFAFSPRDAFIEAESFSLQQLSVVKERARCPFSPLQRNAALAVDGELFTATTTDFRGLKPQISRHFSRDGRHDLSQDSSVSLLEEPTFVSATSDPSDRKLYFFFSEVGKEFSFTDELQIPRVAQVCKDDVGGQRTLQNRWTSFAKASLLCQRPRQLPFNVLQDVFTLPPPGDATATATDTLYYGVFTSQWSSGPESAVCVFKLQDVRVAFSGSYRTFDMETHQWSSVGKHSYLGQCGLGNASDSDLAQVKKSFLTSGGVKPMGDGPVLVSARRYSHVAAMRTQAANQKTYTVLFLLTESGSLQKLVLLDRGVHVIEEVQVFTGPHKAKSLVLSPSKGVVYVGSSAGVSSVPVSHCSGYSSCGQCVLARDPLCGWSRSGAVCGAVGGATEDDTVQVLEDGDVDAACRGQSGTRRATEVVVPLNKVVKLPCVKPSNLAAVSWSSPRFGRLPDDVFLQAADGSLSFLAAADTFGSFACEAREAGVTEVVASYDVRPSRDAAPRAISPAHDHDHDHTDESFEDIATDAPTPSGDYEDNEDDKTTTVLEDETTEGRPGLEEAEGRGFTPTPRIGARSGEEPGGARVQPKSYHSELVVVSLLLAFCVCFLMLGAVHVWRQRRTGLKTKTSPLVSPEDGCPRIPSLESVPSLSEDDATETKIVE